MELHGKQALVRAKLYEQVSSILETRIRDGMLQKDSYLPNEFDLSREFGVSIGTIRKAVDMLVEAQLLVRQPGKGTQVADWRWRGVRDKANRIRRGENAATISWEYRDIERRRMRANAEVARKLKIESGAEVEFVRRLRTATEGARVLEDNYIPDRAPRASDYPGQGVMLVSTNVCGLGRMEEFCWAVPASQRSADLLDIKVGQPLLKMVRVMHNRAGEPIEYREAYLHSRECYFYTLLE